MSGESGPVVGVLALQGDFEAHARTLAGLGARCPAVRQAGQLEALDALVIPGGESTTLIKLMDAFEFWEPLGAFAASGRPVFGTCAGAILLASEVLNPRQRCLGAMDITVERNSYGRQRDSFEGAGSFRPHGPAARSRSRWSSSAPPASPGSAPASRPWASASATRWSPARGACWRPPSTPS